MPSAKSVKRNVGTAIAVVLSAALVIGAQPQQPASQEGKAAEEVYKNIKVLKGTPANQLNQSMHLVKAAVGLDCEDCHDPRDRAADTLKMKETARNMWRMMIDLNNNLFQGRQEVTCYTCHRGSPIPANVPVLPIQQWEEPAKPSVPPLDQILSRYIEALGGERALRKVTSRVVTGTQYIPSGPGGSVPMPATVEKYMKAPSLSLSVYHAPTSSISEGFDGTTAWAQNIQGVVQDAVPLDQTRAKRSSDFYEPLNLKKEYTQMTVDGVEQINGHDAYVVTGHLSNDLLPERLYFDAVTGLLLRKSTALATQAGNSPYEVNYDDYRDTGSGVKFPYRITMNPAGPRIELAPTATLVVARVQDNVAIDDNKFAKPVTQSPTTAER
jgi:photosynthetic reaction center cytochrome c subunit